jgi:hypothetical protein
MIICTILGCVMQRRVSLIVLVVDIGSGIEQYQQHFITAAAIFVLNY